VEVCVGHKACAKREGRKKNKTGIGVKFPRAGKRQRGKICFSGLREPRHDKGKDPPAVKTSQGRIHQEKQGGDRRGKGKTRGG